MSNPDLSVSLEYAMEVLAQLEAFTGKKLNDTEAEWWTERLQKYPRWKLIDLCDYTGALNNGVFKFLDDLRTPPANVREDLGYKPAQLEHRPLMNGEKEKELARDAWAHVQKITGMEFVPSPGAKQDKEKSREEWQAWIKEKRLVEKTGLEELCRKYPYAGFEGVLRERRFAGL